MLFQSPDLHALYDRDGYVVVDGPDESERKELLALFKKLSAEHSKEGTFDTYPNTEIMSVVGARASKYLNNYRPLFASFLVKKTGEDGTVEPHQDWNFVGNDGVSFSYWFPLGPVSAENGTVCVMPGSHRLFSGRIAGIGLRQRSPLAKFDQAFLEQFMRPVPLDPGQAIFIDHGTVHYSPPNRTASPRLAASVCMIPADAAPVHYFGRPDGRIEGYEVEDSFFEAVTRGAFSADIFPPRSLGFFETPAPKFGPEEIIDFYAKRSA